MKLELAIVSKANKFLCLVLDTPDKKSIRNYWHKYAEVSRLYCLQFLDSILICTVLWNAHTISKIIKQYPHNIRLKQ